MEQITGKDLVELTGRDLLGISPMSGVCIMTVANQRRDHFARLEEIRVEELRIEEEANKESIVKAYCRISKAVCAYYDLPIDRLVLRSRKRLYVKCRQIICYFMKQHKGKFALTAIAEPFGYDHTTVIHCIKTVQDLMDTEPDYKAHIETLTKLLQ